MTCHILNTRPMPQQQLNDEIISLGGTVTSMPLLTIKPIFPHNWQDKLHSINNYDIAIFISKNAVDCFFNLTKEYNQQTWPDSILTIAIGKATYARLAAKNIKTITQAEDTSESLLALSELQNVAQKKILLIKGIGGREVLQHTLIKRGAIVECLEVYERIKTQYPPSIVKEIWQDDSIDIILFTSNEAIEHMFSLFTDFHTWLQTKPCVVISQRLAKIAQEKGMKKIFVTSPNQILQGLIGACASTT